jgi:signal transduction histidine kinase
MGQSDVARRRSIAGTATAAAETPISIADPFAHEAREHSLPVEARHDLRHEAATILLLIATVRDEQDDSRRAAAYDGIAHCATTIAAILNEVDDEVRPGPIRLDEVARLGTMRMSLLHRGVIKCDAAPAMVLANSSDASRLFANLIENSCRAAGADGVVEVTVLEREGWCELQVGDSGAGFVEATGPGGIGLSSVTAIAVRLGGEVTFGRSTLGGALVTVRLPRFELADAANREGTPT